MTRVRGFARPVKSKSIAGSKYVRGVKRGNYSTLRPTPLLMAEDYMRLKRGYEAQEKRHREDESLRCYALRYKDLLDAYCAHDVANCNFTALQTHWRSSGRAEGRTRQCIPGHRAASRTSEQDAMRPIHQPEAASPSPSSRAGLCHDTSLHRLDKIRAEQLVEEKATYWAEGYVVVRQVFTPDEMAFVRDVVQSTAKMQSRVATLREKQAAGEKPAFSTIFTWNDVDAKDIFAKVGKSHKILDRLSCFFNDDVYDYHNKIVLKYPGIVGFRPHQDYWYWHKVGVNFPEASAVYIAIDEATQDNGCLQVVPRSHLLGLLNHSMANHPDSGIEPDTFAALLATGYESVPVPLRSGDAIFFTGQTIHLSDDNRSNKSRIAMIATMNTRHASPDEALTRRSGHPTWSHQERCTSRITKADVKLPLPDFEWMYGSTRMPGRQVTAGS